MDNVPEETHVVSAMTKWPLATVAVIRDEKDDRLLPHQLRRQRLTVKKATEMKALTKRVRFCADTKIVKKPSCKIWHHPVCQNCRSESGCTYGDKCRFRPVEAEEKPSKKVKERWCERTQLLNERSLFNWVLYLKILIRESLFKVNLESWDRNTPSHSPRAPGTK